MSHLRRLRYCLIAFLCPVSVAADGGWNTDDHRLVTGTAAQHGPAFYESEIFRCRQLLRDSPEDFDARHRLATALLRLSSDERAEIEWKRNEVLHPGRQQTAIGLSSLYLKRRQFSQSACWAKLALDRQSSGQTGPTLYLLRMIEWRLRNDFDPQLSTRNFLGIDYDAGPYATAAIADRELLTDLIRDNQRFADAYVVLGDVLYAEGELETALRAYVRAESIGADRAVPSHVLADRTANTSRALRKCGTSVSALQRLKTQISMELTDAESWRQRYLVLEAERLERGEPVDPASMKEAMGSRRRFQFPKISESEDRTDRQAFLTSAVRRVPRQLVLYGSLLSVIACALFVARRRRTELS